MNLHSTFTPRPADLSDYFLSIAFAHAIRALTTSGFSRLSRGTNIGSRLRAGRRIFPKIWL
jgi:hypothetical protein